MPRTSTDPLKAFVSLRASLESRRAQISAEIAEIDAALGSVDSGTPAKAKVKAARAAVTKPARARRAKNELSLKEAVVQALGQTALSKEDILKAVDRLGYKFSAKNPVGSLNSVLYGKKPKFKSADGKFSLV